MKNGDILKNILSFGEILFIFLLYSQAAVLKRKLRPSLHSTAKNPKHQPEDHRYYPAPLRSPPVKIPDLHFWLIFRTYLHLVFFNPCCMMISWLDFIDSVHVGCFCLLFVEMMIYILPVLDFLDLELICGRREDLFVLDFLIFLVFSPLFYENPLGHRFEKFWRCVFTFNELLGFWHVESPIEQFSPDDLICNG